MMRARIFSASLFLIFSLFFSSCSLQAKDGIDIDGKIVFYSNRDNDKWGLYLYEGGRIKFLIRSWPDAVWFSDGARLLAAGGSDAVIVGLNGEILNRMTLTTELDISRPTLLHDESGFVVEGLKRSKRPDGVEMSVGVANIYLYDFQEKSFTNVTSFNQIGLIPTFDTSPVNDWVAFSWVPEGGENEAFLLNLKTKEKIKLVDFIWNVQWTPDGKTLYYERKPRAKSIEEWRGIRSSLFSYDPETKASTLVHEPFGSTGFRFSPDGKKILFSNWCTHGICLFLFDLETKETKHLLKPVPGRTINDTNPDWHA